MISDQVILTNQQALNLLFNVGGLMVLAFLIGFLFGVISESKLRDNLDKARDASQSGGLILRCQERHAEVGQCELASSHKGSHLSGYLMWPPSGGAS